MNTAAKLLAVLATALLSISTTAAQPQPDPDGQQGGNVITDTIGEIIEDLTTNAQQGDIGGTVNSLGNLLSKLLSDLAGIETGLGPAIIFLTFTMFLVYIFVEKGLETIGAEDMFIETNRQGEESRLRLYLLTFFIFGGLLVSNFLGALLMILSTSTLLFATAIIIMASGSALYFVFDLGVSANTGMKQRAAERKEQRKEATENLRKSEKELKDAAKEAESLEEAEREVDALLNEGDIKRAEQDAEVILSKINNTMDAVEEAEERVYNTIEMLEEQGARDVKNESDIRNELSNAFSRLTDMKADFDEIENNNTDWPGLTANGPGDWTAISQEIDNALDTFEIVLADTAGDTQLASKLNQLEDTLQNDIQILEGDINNIETECRTMADMVERGDDYERIKNEVQQGQSLENRLKEIMNKNEKLQDEIEDAKQQISDIENNESDLLDLFGRVEGQVSEINNQLTDPNFINTLGNPPQDLNPMTIQELANEFGQMKTRVDQIRSDI